MVYINLLMEVLPSEDSWELGAASQVTQLCTSWSQSCTASNPPSHRTS